MSESGEDSSASENNWPMNEEWLIGILKGDDQTDGKVKINVNLLLPNTLNVRINNEYQHIFFTMNSAF